MKFCSASRPTERIGKSEGLVLTASGTAQQTTSLLSQTGPALATLLDLPLRWISLDCSPHEALVRLQGGEYEASTGGWLGVLSMDPGLPLEAGGGWVDVLAAYCQPTLAFLTDCQLKTGLPAATTALMVQAKVPLIGLIQWGKHWDPLARRQDGLPWLGAMNPNHEPATEADRFADNPDEEALRLALRHRWSQIRSS